MEKKTINRATFIPDSKVGPFKKCPNMAFKVNFTNETIAFLA